MLARPFEGIARRPGLATIASGSVQRLFSTFPNSWPGAGLLLVRICLGAALMSSGLSGLSLNTVEAATFVQSVVTALGSVLVLAGLWTPLTGVLVAVVEIWKALSLGSTERDLVSIHAFLAVLSLSLGMLGPGAWSID